MAGLLSSGQLSAFSAAQTAAMDLSGIQVKRATRTPDASGTYSESWSTIATVSGGWAKPTAAIMTTYAGIIGSLKAWVVRLPLGTDVRNDDRLVMPSGDTLTVQADLSQRSYATVTRVLATEVV